MEVFDVSVNEPKHSLCAEMCYVGSTFHFHQKHLCIHLSRVCTNHHIITYELYPDCTNIIIPFMNLLDFASSLKDKPM